MPVVFSTSSDVFWCKWHLSNPVSDLGIFWDLDYHWWALRRFFFVCVCVMLRFITSFQRTPTLLLNRIACNHQLWGCWFSSLSTWSSVRAGRSAYELSRKWPAGHHNVGGGMKIDEWCCCSLVHNVHHNFSLLWSGQRERGASTFHP